VEVVLLDDEFHSRCVVQRDDGEIGLMEWRFVRVPHVLDDGAIGDCVGFPVGLRAKANDMDARVASLVKQFVFGVRKWCSSVGIAVLLGTKTALYAVLYPLL